MFILKSLAVISGSEIKLFNYFLLETKRILLGLIWGFILFIKLQSIFYFYHII